MTDRERVMEEARRLLAFLGAAGLEHDLAVVADALLEAEARGVEQVAQKMRKRVWGPAGEGELPDGAVPCWYLNERAAELRAKKVTP